MVSNALYGCSPREEEFAFVTAFSTDKPSIDQANNDKMDTAYSTNVAKKKGNKLLGSPRYRGGQY
jgi:hypothetical protein